MDKEKLLKMLTAYHHALSIADTINHAIQSENGEDMALMDDRKFFARARPSIERWLNNVIAECREERLAGKVLNDWE